MVMLRLLPHVVMACFVPAYTVSNNAGTAQIRKEKVTCRLVHYNTGVS